MRAAAFLKAITMDTSGLLERLVERLQSAGIRFCVIGGQGVNAYVEPLVSLDLDVVIAADQVDHAAGLLAKDLRVEPFPHSLNVSDPQSDLRVQIQTDPRYGPFVDRARTRTVLGMQMPVAALEDVLQGKIWAALDPTRRPSKRQKDFADIARLLEAYPELRARVPEEILSRLIA